MAVVKIIELVGSAKKSSDDAAQQALKQAQSSLRNIRAIEAATGVDLIIDDTPEAILLSSFDPIRREVARRALERLIQDGRIHPARIEEVVEKVREELWMDVKTTGEAAAL